MLFYSFGINHHCASIELRESYAFSNQTLRSIFQQVTLSPGAEYILLSTCNRMECYLYGNEQDIEVLKLTFSREAGRPWPEAASFTLSDEDAVMHIFEVAGGIDSMVPGDAQILGQIKDAYRLAVEEDAVQSILHRLMHTAFSASKRIVNETKLSAGSSSVAGTAASLAIRSLRAHEGEEILILGAGEMGRLVLDVMSRVSCSSITLSNRTSERLDGLLERYEFVKTVPWHHRYEAVKKASVTIVTTASEEYVLTRDNVEKHSDAQPHVIIDISVPRNVDPGIDTLDEYMIYDLDALKSEIEHVVVLRESDLPAARAICQEMLSDFVSWVFHHQAMQPAIQAILNTFERIRWQEIERNQHRFSETDISELDRLTKSIMQKVLAVPVVRLKNVGLQHIDYVNGIKLLKTLFGREHCDDDAFSDSLDISKNIINTLETKEYVQLSGLASCPFGEEADTNSLSTFDSGPQMVTLKPLVLGTRGSALAIWQAKYVQQLLQKRDIDVSLKRITTRGDKILDRPFSQIEGKALFTKELDLALLDGRIDFAVHSLKDLPTQLPEGLRVAAISIREEPRDVLVVQSSFSGTLEELPLGAIIGTSSLRRTAQLMAWRPDFRIVSVRGNVDSRIKKLDKSDWHGIVLAAAGLIRLGLDARIHTMFDTETLLPAPGQGALAIVCAETNVRLIELLQECIHHEETAQAVRSERALLAALDGGCHVPVGALAERVGGTLILKGFVGTLDGTRTIREQIEVDIVDPEKSGHDLALRMLKQGASEILERERAHVKSNSG